MTLFDKTRIEYYERRNRRLFREAFETARNRKTVSRTEKDRIEYYQRGALRAVNSFSRIMWGRALCSQLEQNLCFEGTTDHKQDMFFVTLVDSSCATSTIRSEIDIHIIKQRLRFGLRGLSYVAIIEPAFYTNLRADPGLHYKRQLYWHLHAVVWGMTKANLKKLIRQINKSGRYVPVIDRLKGVHQKTIRPGGLPGAVSYMLKSPGATYRVFQVDRYGPDGSPLITRDGEIKTRFLQKKGKLRKGERIILFRAMKDLRLDGLALAGGEGVPMLARAKRMALST